MNLYVFEAQITDAQLLNSSGIFEFIVREYQLAEGVMQYAQTV